jgi:hypothetical protein
MVTHADHDAFAKQAAEAVYPASDDEEDEADDKGWGAKEWLTLALASGTLATGLGAAYLYRKEIGDFLKDRIGGDQRGAIDKFTQEHTGMAPGTLAAIAGGAHATITALRKSPLGDARAQQTLSGLSDTITKGGEHGDALLKNLGNTTLPGANGAPQSPTDAATSIQRHIGDATSNPKNTLAILNNPNNVLDAADVSKGTPITNTANKPWLSRMFQGTEKKEFANISNNAKLVTDKANEARTILFNNGHDMTKLTPQHRNALTIDADLHRQVGSGSSIDPRLGVVTEHAKAINAENYIGNIGKAQKTFPKLNLGKVVTRMAVPWAATTGLNGIFNMATGH